MCIAFHHIDLKTKKLSSNLGSQACDGTEEIVGMTCSASSEYWSISSCQKAIDDDADTFWASKGEGVGAWIQLDFGGVYNVTSLEFKHRDSPELFKDFNFNFSNGEITGPFRLDNDRGRSYTFTLPSSFISSYVRIRAVTHYTATADPNSGFRDIKVYGCRGKPSKNEIKCTLQGAEFN